MSPRLPFLRRRDDEPRSLHASLAAASGGDPSNIAAALAALAGATVWIAAADGLEGGVERLAARARLSGFAKVGVRVGRLPDGSPFMVAATTAARLESSGLTEPGDTLATMALRDLAQLALANGLETIVVNPGTVPFAHLAGGALRSIADGVQPDGADPDRRANVRPDQLRVRHAPVPDELAAAVAAALSAEPVEAAAIVPAEVSGSPVWVFVLDGPVSPALESRLIEVASPLVGSATYLTVKSIESAHPWLRGAPPARVVVDRRPPNGKSAGT